MNNDWKPTEYNIGKPMNSNNEHSGYFDWRTAQIHQPKVICTCDIFGQGQMVVSFYDIGPGVRPIPNRWIRFWTRVFFNSKWNFKND